jgi:hypothetical protein
LPGCKPIINLTLTSFVTSRSLIRTGILISSGIGKLDRFNQVFWAKLLPVSLNLESTSSRSQDGKADPQIPLTRVAYVPKGDTRNKIVSSKIQTGRTISSHKKPRSMSGLPCFVLIATTRFFFVYRTRPIQSGPCRIARWLRGLGRRRATKLHTHGRSRDRY